MLAIETIKSLKVKGFSMAEMASIQNDEAAKTVLGYLDAGMEKADVLEYVKASGQVTTKIKSSGKPTETPKFVLKQGADVLRAEVNFGGMADATFKPWNGKTCLNNKGTGSRANSLFLVLGNEGELDVVNALNQLELASKCFYQHLEVIETAKAHFTKKAEELGAI